MNNRIGNATDTLAIQLPARGSVSTYIDLVNIPILTLGSYIGYGWAPQCKFDYLVYWCILILS